VNPLELIQLAKQYLKSPNRNRDKEANIRRRAVAYQTLITDERYKEVLVDLFTNKIAEKEKAILAIPLTDSIEDIGKRHFQLITEKNVFEKLLKYPEDYIRENETLKVVEELERRELINNNASQKTADK
jgi:hypothetical protein